MLAKMIWKCLTHDQIIKKSELDHHKNIDCEIEAPIFEDANIGVPRYEPQEERYRLENKYRLSPSRKPERRLSYGCWNCKTAFSMWDLVLTHRKKGHLVLDMTRCYLLTPEGVCHNT